MGGAHLPPEVVALCILVLTLALAAARLAWRSCGDDAPPPLAVRASAVRRFARGVFAVRACRAGEVVERCPIVYDDFSALSGSALMDYVFLADDGRAAVPLGLCMMYNHHPTHPNVGHELDATDAQYMRVVALRDLRCGQELFTHYGDAYWEARGIQPVVPP